MSDSKATGEGSPSLSTHAIDSLYKENQRLRERVEELAGRHNHLLKALRVYHEWDMFPDLDDCEAWGVIHAALKGGRIDSTSMAAKEETPNA